MVNIFVLKLENDKFFIGETNDEIFDLNLFKSEEYEWTTKYKPISIIEIIKKSNYTNIDKYVLEYMTKQGAKNVRGGKYQNKILDNNQKTIIDMMLSDETTKCYICGNGEHISKDCIYKNWEKDEDEINIIEKKCTINFVNTDYDIFNIKKKNIEDIKNNIKKDDIVCYRCGRKGHLVQTCYASTHFYGENLDRCYTCGRDDHSKKDCKYTTDIYGRKITNLGMVLSLLSLTKEKFLSVKKLVSNIMS